MTSNDFSKGPRLALTLLFFGFAVGALIGIFVWKRPGPPTGQEALRLIERKNFAVGSLENLPNDDRLDGEECVATLQEITSRLLDEPFGPTNLAIARLVLLERLVVDDNQQNSADLPSTRFQETQQAIALLQEQDGNPLTVRMLETHLIRLGLAGKVLDDPQQLIDAFTSATVAAPDDPLVWSEFYVTTQEFPDDVSQAASRDALQKAYELRPDNVVLLMEWLMAQAEAKDPAIGQTLIAAKSVLRPLARSIAQRGVVLDESIDAAIAAVVSGGDNAWAIVLSRLRPLVNVVRPESAYQLDRPRLERHVLEYMIEDFSGRFYEQAGLPEPSPTSGVAVRFARAPEASQLPLESGARAVCVLDFDLDGRLDVACLTDAAIQVFGPEQNGGGWRLLARAELDSEFDQIAAADLDRDEDLDLIVSGVSGVRLLENQSENETRTLAPVSVREGFEQLQDVGCLAIADLEQDGDLDLVLSSSAGLSLWSNHEGFQFAEITAETSLPPDSGAVTAIVPVDWNRDVAIDVILCGADGAILGVLENIHHNRFRWRAFDVAALSVDGAIALAVADVDGNASWDLVLGSANGVTLVESETSPLGRVTLQSPRSASAGRLSGLTTWDYDNDGRMDMVAWGQDGVQVLRGVADGQFQAADDLLTDSPGGVRACAVGDLDQDGDLDLVLADEDHCAWYVNAGGNANHWIDITLKAEAEPQFPSQRTNSYGVGSLLELKSGPVYQARVVTGQSTHFGLGQRDRADVVRVLFTNGIPQNVLAPEAGQRIITEQRLLKGSCPYVYTWTGERYEFFTDLLWASPIGLQFAEGVLAPARECEYLLIHGDRLVAQDGQYRLQITEELWEAAYFDQVRLIAVDHPAEVAVYSNEKVGPAEIAQFKVHTVRNPLTPIAAEVQHGRDALPLIANRDDRYLKAYNRRLKQGLTEPQTLELDLGTWENPDRFTLFLTGWVMPTDTSLNIAISQDEQTPAPIPPSLSVPDAQGMWREVLPYTGFPGGKTKTIAVKVPGDAFAGGDYRVRIATSMELCWDEIFFTVDEPESKFQLTEMLPASADLHDRGFSQRVEHPQHGPESYDYEKVTSGPRWPPMEGRFTRYGDVTELVRDADDLLVVMGAGDEMTLTFTVPDGPLPDGWQRDFLLHNVGWDKDADLNTVLGQTVEPLPFRAMKTYPYPPEVTWPDTPQHRAYLEKYQTREQNRGTFWTSIFRSTAESTSVQQVPAAIE